MANPQRQQSPKHLILPNPPSHKPYIVSPVTGKPLVEEYLGERVFKEILRMVEKDERLSPGQKHEVLVKVLKRRHEIDSGAKTVGDVTAEEARKVLREN